MSDIQTYELWAEDLSDISLDLKAGDIVFLRWDLWAGKTTLVTHLIRNLLWDPDLVVTSPTYTYYQSYGDWVTHFDLYRVENYDDFVRIWAQEILDEGDTISFIEWPEKIADTYQPTYDIQLSHTHDQNRRKITIQKAD